MQPYINCKSIGRAMIPENAETNNKDKSGPSLYEVETIIKEIKAASFSYFTHLVRMIYILTTIIKSREDHEENCMSKDANSEELCQEMNSGGKNTFQ